MFLISPAECRDGLIGKVAVLEVCWFKAHPPNLTRRALTKSSIPVALKSSGNLAAVCPAILTPERPQVWEPLDRTWINLDSCREAFVGQLVLLIVGNTDGFEVGGSPGVPSGKNDLRA